MPRRCSVCDHPGRTEIDRLLVRGAAYRRIAAEYSLSESAVRRHAAEHLPKVLTAAAEEEERLTATALLDDLRRLQKRCERILDRLDGADDKLALLAVRELRGVIGVGLRGIETVELEERLHRLEELTSEVNPTRRMG